MRLTSRKVISFLFGQGISRIVDLAIALILMRILPINEFALYTFAFLFVSMGAVGTNFGISRWLVTKASKTIGNKEHISSLFQTAVFARRILYFIATLLILIAFPLLAQRHNWDLASLVATVAVILTIVWLKQQEVLRTEILNAHHDASAINRALLLNSVLRLVFILIFCTQWPYALVALLASVISTLLANQLLKTGCRKFMDFGSQAEKELLHDLVRFSLPLAPGALYFVFQSQIAVFLISIYGSTESLAEVGALLRIVLIISFLAVLNNFMFQPLLARTDNRDDAIRLIAMIAGVLLFIIGLFVASSIYLPDIWLLLLGPKYSELGDLVPIVVLTGGFSLMQSFLFSVMLSRAYTKWHSLYIVPSLLTIGFFVFFFGAGSTQEVMILNMANTFVFMVFEMVLLVQLLKNWR